jgi:hypothetical protein
VILRIATRRVDLKVTRCALVFEPTQWRQQQLLHQQRRRQVQQLVQRELYNPKHWVFGDGWMLKAGCDRWLCRQ